MRTTHPRNVAWIGILTLAIATSQAFAFSSGPPDHMAGNPPAFTSCQQCHGTAVGDGMLALLDLPASYEEGVAYDLRVELQDPGQMRWGFELTVLDDVMNEQAGTLEITDAVNTQLSDNPSPDADFVKHTGTGTFAGTPDGPVTWDFRWVAPAGDADLTFYVAGNAANNNGNTSGDFIYLITAELSASTIGVELDPAPALATGLGASYPNPARFAASIPYHLGAAEHVTLRIMDVNGRVVRQLLDRPQAAGTYEASWDGRDATGQRAASGIYFIVLDAGEAQTLERLVITR
jgi:hypothetical protein